MTEEATPVDTEVSAAGAAMILTPLNIKLEDQPESPAAAQAEVHRLEARSNGISHRSAQIDQEQQQLHAELTAIKFRFAVLRGYTMRAEQAEVESAEEVVEAKRQMEKQQYDQALAAGMVEAEPAAEPEVSTG